MFEDIETSKKDLKTNLYITKINDSQFKIVINGKDWDFTTKVDAIMVSAGVKLTPGKLKTFQLLYGGNNEKSKK